MKTTIMKNKKDYVYAQLRDNIISCSLKPGLPINEADFAENYGVSKTPIREAIRQLEREGLVRSIPGRGSIISYISSDDIYETFEIREIFECGVARRACRLNNKDSLIDKLEELRMLKKNLEKNEYVENWDFCDDIHLEIITAIENARLLHMYQGLLDTIERIRNHFGHRFSGRRIEHIIDEHVGILHSIIEGDEEQAQIEVKKHLHNAYAYISSLS